MLICLFFDHMLASKHNRAYPIPFSDSAISDVHLVSTVCRGKGIHNCKCIPTYRPNLTMNRIKIKTLPDFRKTRVWIILHKVVKVKRRGSKMSNPYIYLGVAFSNLPAPIFLTAKSPRFVTISESQRVSEGLRSDIVGGEDTSLPFVPPPCDLYADATQNSHFIFGFYR